MDAQSDTESVKLQNQNETICEHLVNILIKHVISINWILEKGRMNLYLVLYIIIC